MGNLQQLSSRDIVGRFFQRLEAATGMNWIQLIAMIFPTNQATENYKWLGFSPALREWVGNRQSKNLQVGGVSITNVLYESSLEIDVDDMRRDKTGQINIRIDEMAVRAIAHWASLFSTLIINGESSVCYDGQYFFDTDHSEGDSGSQTNDLGSGDYSELNVGTAANPTADELANVILKMLQHQFSYKDDRGEPMNELARKFLLMCPVGMWGNAQQAIRSKLLNTGSGSRENPLANTEIEIVPVANPRLTWTTKLALFRADGTAKPFIGQAENLNNQDSTDSMVDEKFGIQLQVIAEGSELEVMRNKHLYGIKASRNVDYGYWQHATLATLS